MKLIVGLGNPGTKYQNNRHNVGHMFVDYLKKNPDPNFKRVKTTVFMNQSGDEIKKLISYYKLALSDLVVVHDDLDIPLGKFKIQKSAGPQLHNGLTSIEKALGAKDFWRVRIGVDNRASANRIDGETYVLQDLRPDEKKLLPRVFQQVVDKWENVFHNGLIQ